MATPKRKTSETPLKWVLLVIGAISLQALHTTASAFEQVQGSERSYYATSVNIPMRDGAMLAANLIRPSQSGPSPVIVSITPYGRHGGHNFGVGLARQGFVALLVDTRGRGDSSGKFVMFESDLNDTVDVIAWAAEQPFSNGKIAMWGSSYGGYNQWMAAARQAEALVSIAPGAAVFPGWDFPMTTNVGYPYSSIWPAFTKGRMSNQQLFADQLYWREAFTDFLTQGIAFRELDRFVGFDTDLFDLWTSHPHEDSFWRSLNPTQEEFSRIDLPVLSVTGLYDGAQTGALRYYEEHLQHASPKATENHYFVIGPYDHTGVVFPRDRVGGLNVPDASGIDPKQLQIEWYHWTMNGGAKPAFLKDNFIYYVMGEGANNWRYAPSLRAVEEHTQTFWLAAKSNNPTSVKQAGSLIENRGDASKAHYEFDPTDISKAALGSWFKGDFATYDDDISAIDGEALIFETAPFVKAMELTGRPEFHAKIAINTPDTDFQLRLYEVLPDGSSIHISEARARARYRETYSTEKFIDTQATLEYAFESFSFASRRLQIGSKLRFVFGAPNSIYIQRNYNTAKPVADQTPADALTATIQMMLGGDDGARLVLPLRSVNDEARPDKDQQKE